MPVCYTQNTMTVQTLMFAAAFCVSWEKAKVDCFVVISLSLNLAAQEK